MSTITINGVEYEVTESGEGSMAQPMERDISWLAVDPDTQKVIYCKNYNGQCVKLSSALDGTRENYAATEYAAGLLNTKIEGLHTTFSTSELTVNGNASITGNATVSGTLTATSSKAIADESGNNIVNTYATKTALSTAIANVTFPKGLDYAYDATKDYTVGEIVFYSGSIYMCLSANGASTTVVTPSTDPDVWSRIPTENQIPSGKNIDELVFSISPLTDSGLKLADGSLVSNGAYHQYYAKKLADYNNADIVANAKQVGNLTNVDGVYSGFSNSDYLTLAMPVSVGSTSWEINFKITTSSDVSSWQSIINQNVAPIGLALLVAESKFKLWLGSTGNTWNIAEQVAGNYAVLANTTYWLRIAFNGSQYVFSYSLDGSSFVTDITVTSSTPISQSLKVLLGSHTGQNFSGSIDLNETSITIGGNLWWQGAVKKGFTNEAYWQSFVSTYGSCGKFVIDTVNETIRLPKLTGFLEGTVDVNALSELKEAGLPNVEGDLSDYFFGGNNGAIIQSTTALWQIKGGAYESSSSPRLRLDASRSSPIYGNNDTVQPQSISVFIYIVIANAQKTSISVDIDEVMTDVNNLESNKADKDFSNVTDTAKVMMAKASMPSDRYVDLTLGASGATYTAPADGFFDLAKQIQSGDTNVYCYMVNNSISGSLRSKGIPEYVNGTPAGTCEVWIPARKGDQIGISYTATGSVVVFRFVYAQGAVSEA